MIISSKISVSASHICKSTCWGRSRERCVKLLVQCRDCIYRPAWGSWDNSDYQTMLPPAWFNRRRFWWRTLELQLGMIIKPSSKVRSPWATLTNDITIASRKGMWCLVSLRLTFSCHKNWWMRSALLLVTHSTNICRGASPPKHFLFWVKPFKILIFWVKTIF